MKSFLKAAIIAFARSNLGQRFLTVATPELESSLLIKALDEKPNVCLEVLGKILNASATFDSRLKLVQKTRVHGFGDLVWLFSSTPANRGIICLDFDEAAYIFELLGSMNAAKCVEIGRFKGGSSFLMAAAMDDKSQLISIDNHTKMPAEYNGDELDASLKVALAQFGLESRVELITADSTKVPFSASTNDLVFIDGDHSYEGVRKDYLHWRTSLKPGGHVIFHDAATSRDFTTADSGPARLVREIEENDAQFITKIAEVGSLAHFCTSGEPFPVD